jgi:hypothetical protein
MGELSAPRGAAEISPARVSALAAEADRNVRRRISPHAFERYRRAILGDTIHMVRRDAQRGRPMNDAQKEATWFHRLRSSWLGVNVVAVVIIIGGAAYLTDSLDKIAVWSKLKADSFQIAKANEKQKFSRDLTRAMWQRLYLSDQVLAQIKATNVPSSEREKTWDRYKASVDDWNGDLMVNILSIAEYYTHEKRFQFEAFVQPRFSYIHGCLTKFYRLSAEKICLTGSQGLKLQDDDENGGVKLNTYIDDFRPRLYCYVSGLPDDEQKCFGDFTDSVFQKRVTYDK